jgi:putative spermidine/putrescine transport system substrate-binding protein
VLHPSPIRSALLGLSLCVLVAACGVTSVASPPPAEGSGSSSKSTGDERPGSRSAPDVADWAAVRAAADGQTVRWWLYGGDERVNRYIDEHVIPAAARQGVTLERVPVTDTADAVQRVVAEVQAGQVDGSVDLIWINGENFAVGRRAGLWLEDWAGQLPNARYVDPATVATDFGVTVDGDESPWSRALFIFAHDTARTPRAPRTFQDLLTYARAHPGRITYPAPPDFTGAAFIRQVVQALGEDAGFAYLQRLQPLLWRKGTAHPSSEAELNRLFGDGQVDLAMSYNPSFVETAVRQGIFPTTARPFVLNHGTLHNVSFVTIPATAGSRAGALVVADLLLDPTLQARKADPDILGVPTVLDPDRLPATARDRLEHSRTSPYLVSDAGALLDELPVDRTEALEDRWRAEVLP